MSTPRNLSKLAEGVDSSGTLTPAAGGTGLTAPGTAGNVLTSDGTDWQSAAPNPSYTPAKAYGMTIIFGG